MVHSLHEDPGHWGEEFRRQVEHLLSTTAPPRQLAVPIPGRHTRQLPDLVAIAERVMNERGYRLAGTRRIEDPSRGVLAHATFTRIEVESRPTGRDAVREGINDEPVSARDEAAAEDSGQTDGQGPGAAEVAPPVASARGRRRVRWRWWR
jgi:hypothetical protein